MEFRIYVDVTERISGIFRLLRRVAFSLVQSAFKVSGIFGNGEGGGYLGFRVSGDAEVFVCLASSSLH